MTIYQHDFRLPDDVPDTEEFEAFWHRTYDRLLRRVSRCYGAADADEIAQKAMLKCYASWSRLDPQRDVWPWLTVVARNVARDHFRARDRREEMESAAAPSTVDPTTPDDEICARELTETVHRALNALPDGDRTVLSLRHLDDMPTAEIASLTGRTDNAVRQHLFRARRNLAVQLRSLTDGATGVFAPVGLWLRRARQTLAGYVPAVDALAVGLSVVTAVSVGVVAGGGARPNMTTAHAVEETTAAPDVAPASGRHVRHLASTSAGLTTRRTDHGVARRAPGGEPSTFRPPPGLSTSGDPLERPRQPSEQWISVEVVPGHDPLVIHNVNETTPGYTVLCATRQADCRDDR